MIVESDAELQRRIGSALRDAGFDPARRPRRPGRSEPSGRAPRTWWSSTRGWLTETASRSRTTCGKPPRRAGPDRVRRQHPPRGQPPRRGAPAIRARRYLPTPLDLAQLAPRVAEMAARARRPAGGTLDPRRRPGHAAARAEGDAQGSRPAARASGRERSAKSLGGDTGDAELQGTLKRTPFARLLQRLYAKRVTGSLLLLHERPRRSSFHGRLPGFRPLERAGRDAGPDPAGEAPDHQRGAGGVGGTHAEGETSPGRDPRRDGRAFALQSGAGAGGTAGGEVVRGLLVVRRQVHVQGGRVSPGENRLLERATAATILEGIRRHYDEGRQDAALEKYPTSTWA